MSLDVIRMQVLSCIYILTHTSMEKHACDFRPVLCSDPNKKPQPSFVKHILSKSSSHIPDIDYSTGTWDALFPSVWVREVQSEQVDTSSHKLLLVSGCLGCLNDRHQSYTKKEWTAVVVRSKIRHKVFIRHNSLVLIRTTIKTPKEKICLIRHKIHAGILIYYCCLDIGA